MLGPMTYSIRPLSDVLGAEVLGIDLRGELDCAVMAELHGAFLTHHVLCFRDQHLDKPAQLAATRRFGALDVHIQRNMGDDIALVHTVSNLDADGRPRRAAAPRGNLRWHSDKSYRTVPSCATFLYGVQVPSEGGRTEFADMCLAYEACPPRRREQLDGLKVVHDWVRSCRKSGEREASAEEAAVYPPVAHPLVRTHPESGRRAFFIGNHASHIMGMDRSEGEALLAGIEADGTGDGFVYRHVWRKGDLLMWDNRCLLHRAEKSGSLDREPRVLHRTVTRGTAPF